MRIAVFIKETLKLYFFTKRLIMRPSKARGHESVIIDHFEVYNRN